MIALARLLRGTILIYNNTCALPFEVKLHVHLLGRDTCLHDSLCLQSELCVVHEACPIWRALAVQHFSTLVTLGISLNLNHAR